MPAWKKVIVSGSDAILNSLIVTNGVTITGSLSTTGSNTLIGSTTLTGSLNISGSTTQIGSNNLLGQTNLSGSIYVSGSMNALADFTLGGTLRLDPAQDPGNTNETASFLFTSASNTEQGYDLYYRQDGNLVKFKWLEGGISSGLLYGGVISASGATIFVSSGSGILLDPNAGFSKEINPIFTYVTWPNYSASATYLTSSQNTYLYVDAAGTIHQQTEFFDQTQYEQAIPLGRATHPNYATITGIGSNVQTTYDSDNQQSAFIRAFGPLKISGFSINAHPGTLGFGVGSGIAYHLGGFYPQDPNSPSHYNGSAFATSSIARAYRSGSGVRLDNNGGAFYSTVDPDYWDDGTGVLNTMAAGDWQIQRVFANPVTGRVVVYYGQNTYTTLLNALQYLATDSFTEGDFTAHSLIFVGYLVLKGQTNNLTDTNNNRIINAGIFRNIAGGSSGGGAVAQTLNDLGDVTITTPTNGQALIYNSGTWENGTPSLAATASYVLNAVSASFAATASYVNTLTQSVLITGSAAIGTSSIGPFENTLTLGARDAASEGGQIGFNAPGGTYTSASFIDNWQNKARILKGNNTTSTGLIAQWDIHTTQMQLPAYTGASSFPGTATANLAVDSAGNVITVSTTGGTVFPYTGNAVITGSLTVTQPISVPINGGMYFQGGDDAALYDINVSNHMGIYGVQDSTVGAIKLGSSGPVLYGSGSKLGIGTTNPSSASLTVNGNVWATSFTGSLQGTASYALNTVSASYSQTASYVNPLNQTVEITGSLLVQNSIDSSLRFLFDSLGTSSLDWEDGYLYNGSGSISVDWRDRKLYDSNVDNSINWDSRQLIKSDGTTVTLNWETGAFTGSMLGTASFATQALSSSFATTASYILNGGGSTFPFTGSALITGSLGITGSLTISGSTYGIKSSTGELLTNNTSTVAWGNLILSDTAGQQSVKWGDRTLHDQAGSLKLDWENGITYDSIGKDSINWQNRQLINTGLVPTVDWETTILFDGSTIESVNWSQRRLYDSSNTLVLDWEANTFTGNSNTATSATSASFASTASFVNTLNQDLTISGTLNVTNLNALTSSIQYITSSQLDISTNIIKLNTTAPLRYGGIAVVDSGSLPQTSGSLLFDSQNNQWIYVHQSTAGSPTTSSILIMGPQTFNNIGNEITIGTNRLTKGSAGDLGEHITSSNITDTGTVVSINSNTEVTGSLTVNGSFIATGSNGTINTDTSNLLSSDILSVDWGNRRLYDNSGLQTSLNWRIRNLFDSNESSSLDWTTRQLNNAASTPTVDWNNNILYDSNAVDSVDWDNRNLFDSNFKKSTDWRIRNLFDSNESSSLAWQARQLNNNSGNTVLTWLNGIEITKPTVITGSLRGNVSALSIASNTASLDMSTNNFFTLNLVNGANTHINPTNINPGQTVNIRVNQGSAGTGTVSFPSFVDQPSGSAYTGSQIANAIDIVTMITFDSSLVFVSSIRNMI